MGRQPSMTFRPALLLPVLDLSLGHRFSKDTHPTKTENQVSSLK